MNFLTCQNDRETHFMSISTKGNAESPSKAKVRKFEVQVFVNEQILRFEITVQNSMRMTII